jgi:cytidylate kinase
MTATPVTIIAIDGGAASGKSSTSRLLADRFNLLHVDTGSFYRHLTAELLRRGVPHADRAALTASLPTLQLSTRLEGRSARMLVDGKPAGDEIRDQRVNDNVSHYAAIPEVRQVLLGYQRGQTEVARQHGFRGLVMEGRDIGSVIFPDADLRFFLHADPAERAKRRAAEGRQDSVAERDRLDSSRKNAPLVVPAGAIDIDSTFLTLEQVVDKMAALIAPKLPA